MLFLFPEMSDKTRSPTRTPSPPPLKAHRYSQPDTTPPEIAPIPGKAMGHEKRPSVASDSELVQGRYFEITYDSPRLSPVVKPLPEQTMLNSDELLHALAEKLGQNENAAKEPLRRVPSTSLPVYQANEQLSPASSDSSISSSQTILNATPRLGFWQFSQRYLGSELGVLSQLNETDAHYDIKRERVSNFLNVPAEIERLMMFGYLICLDAFLAGFTLYPVRVLMALISLIRNLFLKYVGR